ncbi:MAG: 16S rRNA (cytosine1402-N4)-methyltransferase [Flavobacteriales bacterium]|jgi:16S rRNA (cytosine1402-N4)-methyltransferase
MSNEYHKSVLLESSVDALNINPNGVYVDLTFGGGGHSKEILSRLDKGKLFAFDQDQDALKNTIDDERFTLISQNFRFLKNHLRMLGIKEVDGILGDLGVSSHQFDIPDRGFSIRFDADLDMRMNQLSPLTAKKILNTYDENDLKKLFFVFGDLRNSGKIARTIIQSRAEKKINRVDELKEILKHFAPPHKWNSFLAKVFQALRIEVNEEVKVLEEMLLQTGEILKPDGRLVVISYHSIEDRLVKNYMRSGNLSGEVEKDFYGNALRPFKPHKGMPVMPDAEELAVNNRARSARMRIADRL